MSLMMSFRAMGRGVERRAVLGGALLLGALVFSSAWVQQSEGETVPVKHGSFSHVQHFNKGLSQDCGACHGGDGRGGLQAPGANHAPCNSCHAEEFAKRDSKLCQSCHEDSDPWVKNKPIAQLSGGASSFVAGFSHKDHTGRIDALKGGDCATCHPVQSGQEAPTPIKKKGRGGATGLYTPAAHTQCAQCHSNLAPKMDDCAGCHRLPEAGAEASKVKVTPIEWRVGAKFTHGGHLSRGMKCDNCHAGVLTVEPGEAVPKPTKVDCAGCHNGKTAFSVTGHDCAKCHGPK